MASEYGAAQPIVDLAKSASNSFYDWGNLGPVKRAIKSASDAIQSAVTPKSTKKPIAVSWAYYGKPQPRPGDDKPTTRKAIPKVSRR